jgi:hypothetical protein
MYLAIKRRGQEDEKDIKFGSTNTANMESA